MNKLLALIKKASFDPRKFKREDKTNAVEFVYNNYCDHFHNLQLGDTGVGFKIAVGWIEGTRHFSIQQGYCTFDHDGPSLDFYKDWSNWTSDFGVVEKSFADWLNSEGKEYFQYLADEEEERETPDLWEELDIASADLSELENTPFTEEERTQITHKLNIFMKEVERRALLSEDAFRVLQERVEYSIESSQRLSRKIGSWRLPEH